MPTGQSHLDWTLAILNVAGGTAGYLKARSVPSLVGGCAFGVAYGGTAYYIGNHDLYQGHIAGATTSALLCSIMGTRYAKTRKVMPAGLLAAAGLGALAYHAQKAYEWSP